MNLCIILTTKERFKKATRGLSVLLFFISTITFQTLVFADMKEQTAEEYRSAGYQEQEKGNLNAALTFYTKAISLGSEDPILYNDIGVLYEQIDLYSQAEKYYLHAIRLDPKYVPPYLNLAYFYQRLGENDKALEYFKKRYELGVPSDPWAQKAKDEILAMDPSYREKLIVREAKDLSEQLTSKAQEEFLANVKRAKEHARIGKEHYEAGRYIQALEEYDAALLLAPGDPGIVVARKKTDFDLLKRTVKEQSDAALMMLDIGDAVSARFEFQKILATIPNEPILISK